MAITATKIRQIDYPGALPQPRLLRYTIPSIPANTIEPDIKLIDVPNPGKLENVRISCDSNAYNFSLRYEPGVVPPSIEELYFVVGVARSYSDDLLDLWHAKPTGPDEECLYMELFNCDKTNATGLVEIELVFIRFD